MEAVVCGQLKSQVVELYLKATCSGMISNSQFQKLSQLECAADVVEIKLIRHLRLLIQRRTIRVRSITS